jgi:hypothetical protein
MAYVDLNPVRAKLADTPETSEYTSVRERFERECAARRQSAKPRRESTDSKAPNPQQTIAWLMPVEDIVVDEEMGSWGVSLEEYLELVDVTGRMIKEEKRGAIPAHLSPMLSRLELRVETWVSSVEGYRTIFQRMAGRRDRLAERAKEAGRKWFCRGSGAKAFYTTEPAEKRMAEVLG